MNFKSYIMSILHL